MSDATRIHETAIRAGESRLATAAPAPAASGGIDAGIAALATDVLAVIELRLGRGEDVIAVVTDVVRAVFGIGPGADEITRAVLGILGGLGVERTARQVSSA